jgi:hypothetical protein
MLFLLALLMAGNLAVHGWIFTAIVMLVLAFRKTRNF